MEEPDTWSLIRAENELLDIAERIFNAQLPRTAKVLGGALVEKAAMMMPLITEFEQTEDPKVVAVNILTASANYALVEGNHKKIKQRRRKLPTIIMIIDNAPLAEGN